MGISDIQNTAATYALKKALEIHGQLFELLPAPQGTLSPPIQKVSMSEVNGKGSIINVMG